MATAASSSTPNTHSPRHHRNPRRATHRAESEDVPAPEPSDGPSPPGLQQQHSETTDRPDDAVVAAAAAAVQEKKSVWSKPSNGVVELGPVMGAVSWPALSEAARASPKSLSSDSLVALSDGSVSSPALSVVANPPPPPPPKPVFSNPNPNASLNHTPARQKSMKRGSGGGGGSGNNNNTSGGGAFPNGGSLPVSPSASVGISTKTVSDRPSVPDQSPKEHPNRSSSRWDHGSRTGGFLPQNNIGNEHHRNGNNRRGNTGGSSDGGNFHHNNYSTRHNHDRGGYEWNTYRNFPGRDIPLHQPHPPRLPQRPFIIPHHVSGPFIGPAAAVRPYGNLIGFHDMNPPFLYMPGPLVPPPMFYQVPDPNVSNSLLRQIEYYFSPENLCKDIFLRQNMEKEGWVPISIIANFNRIKMLTNNTKFILDTVRTSSVLEVMGDKIRRRIDWANWLLPPAANQSTPETPPLANFDTLCTRLNNMVLETETINHDNVRSAQPDPVLDRSSSTEFNKPQATGNLTVERNGKNSGQMG